MIGMLLLFVTLHRLYRDMLKKPETRALLILSAVVFLVGVLFYTLVEGWRLVDAIYFCVVTLGTVGYGDKTPSTDLGKIFTTLYIIVGLSIIGGFIATMGQLINTRAQNLEQEIRRAVPHKTDDPNANR